MWNKELIEVGAIGFRLFGISAEEMGKIELGRDSDLVLLRGVGDEYTGNVVLCCDGETRFMCELVSVERVGRKKWRYVFKDIRACIELPCSVDIGVSEVWYYSPAECLVEYPSVYKRDYKREARIAKWKMRWLGLGWFSLWCLTGLITGALFGLLAKYSVLLVGVLVFVFVVIVGYRGYKIIR